MSSSDDDTGNANPAATHRNATPLEQWRTRCLSTLSGHTCENDLFNHALGLVQEMGFDFLGFGIQLQALISLKTLVKHMMSYLDPEAAEPNKTILLFDNHPPEAMAIFKKEFSKEDPLIRHAKTSTELLVWSESLFAKQPERWALMQGAGLKFGLSQSSRSASGSAALTNISRREKEITRSEVEEKRMKIGILAGILHAEMEIILMRNLYQTMPALSDLDRSILRWSARGKTAKEIAIILEVKERVITTRKGVITQALDAKTFAQAMLIAYSLGLMV